MITESPSCCKKPSYAEVIKIIFLEKQDTEFKLSSMGMWKHAEGTPGFFWNVRFGVGEGITSTGPNKDATGDGDEYSFDSCSNWLG